MNECWKCSRQLPENQVECDPPCGGNPPMEDKDFAEALQRYFRDQVPLDWDKVKTPADLLEIAKVMFQGAKVHRSSDAYQKLKRFLKDGEAT